MDLGSKIWMKYLLAQVESLFYIFCFSYIHYCSTKCPIIILANIYVFAAIKYGQLRNKRSLGLMSKIPCDWVNCFAATTPWNKKINIINKFSPARLADESITKQVPGDLVTLPFHNSQFSRKHKNIICSKMPNGRIHIHVTHEISSIRFSKYAPCFIFYDDIFCKIYLNLFWKKFDENYKQILKTEKVVEQLEISSWLPFYGNLKMSQTY